MNQSEAQAGMEPKTVVALNRLKSKIILDFKTLLKHASKGRALNYNYILEELSLVDGLYCSDYQQEFYFMLQKYINTKWETKLF